MTEFLQLLISGLATGCVYGLVALGFVLIYKAAEVVNFAQGDMLMVGAFFALWFSTGLGLGFWLGLLCAVLLTAAIGWAIDAAIVRIMKTRKVRRYQKAAFQQPRSKGAFAACHAPRLLLEMRCSILVG